jgi:hypothetical protein
VRFMIEITDSLSMKFGTYYGFKLYNIDKLSFWYISVQYELFCKINKFKAVPVLN